MSEKITEHLIFGAGLIGTYLGSAMHYAGLNVTLLVRPKVKDRLSQGVSLSDYEGNTAQVSVSAIDSSNNQHYDVIWLTVKCTGVERACVDVKPFVGENTVIMCCQNGLGSDQIVRQHFPDNTVLRVMVPFNVVEMDNQRFHRGSEGTLTIESCIGLSAELVRDMRSALLPVDETNDMRSLLWAKLQLNLGNSVNALADIPVKQMLEQRGYRKVIAAMMRELLAVVDAHNIELPKVAALPGKWLPFVLELPDFLFTRVANKMLAIDPNVRTSMWWDLHLKRNTEIAHLNGAIVDNAESRGLDCPVNNIIISLIKDAEKKNSQGQELSGLSARELLTKIEKNR